MPEIYPLEPEGLGAGWPNEAQNFTPWLAENLQLLGAQFSLELELERTEVTLPGAGRVDILARQAVTNDRVVIENQLGQSDDSHCLRLLGYAANAEANILIWVARDFTPYYRSILNWLNQSNSIDVYAVAVKLYRVGDVLGVTFQVEVEPQRDQPEALALARATMSTRYADFYRPLATQLRHSGLMPVRRGRWRSFETGYSPDVIYVAGLTEGKAQVFLSIHGDDREDIYQALAQNGEEIDRELDGAIWAQGDRECSVTLQTDGVLSDYDAGDESLRRWMASNLLQLRQVMQPHLAGVMRELRPGHEDAGLS